MMLRFVRFVRPPSRRWFAFSSRQDPPLSLGFVAGIQSNGPDAPFPDFDVAHSLLQSVDPQVLIDFEEELWETERKKFVWGTAAVSVIDSAAGNPGEKFPCTRAMVLNRRPDKIQSVVPILHVGAPGPARFGAPPPLTGVAGTLAGGLALAMPLWRLSGTGRSCESRPRCAVLGAGGCVALVFRFRCRSNMFVF
mmetsp:Transcript_44208/g.86754  ORF Transcript_44208/g.86754 Transcript_44208/m.86754 type:complete len:194 (+) Transcript_44208:31-612(+)